ncbi:hypothetical protein FN846DRAFT_914065, partial [Sphaerosporella brunnea]
MDIAKALADAAFESGDPNDPIVSSQLGDACVSDTMAIDLQGASQWSEPVLTPTPARLFTPDSVPPPPPPLLLAEPASTPTPTPTPPTPGALGAPRTTRAMTRGLLGKTPTPVSVTFNSTPVRSLAESRKRLRNDTPEDNKLV